MTPPTRDLASRASGRHVPTHVPQTTSFPDDTVYAVLEPGGEGTMPERTTDPTTPAGEGARSA